ncbi:MAG: glutathione S-transferase family protein [Alphaproteobacteria bacterium]|nr:glutathione S-transferase family protein [Alphaproteobacteria bacterium]
MLKLLYSPTAAGNKVLIALEELNLEYASLPINVFKKMQFLEAYKSIIPTAKIPSLIDDGKVLFESGAILYYLAAKHGKLMPQNNYTEALSWFIWEQSELSPKFVQHYRAKMQNPDNAAMHASIEDNIKNLLLLLNAHLTGKTYIADEFSIADISVYGWLKHYISGDKIPNLIAGLDNIAKWLSTMDNRESVKKVAALAKNFDWNGEISESELIAFLNK